MHQDLVIHADQHGLIKQIVEDIKIIVFMFHKKEFVKTYTKNTNAFTHWYSFLFEVHRQL